MRSAVIALLRGILAGMLLGLMMADNAAGPSPQESMVAGIMPGDPADYRAFFRPPAAGAGVELAAIATPRRNAAGVRIALIVDTYQKFRDVVFNIPRSICVSLPTSLILPGLSR